MKCQVCGNEIQEHAKFCPKCGNKVEHQPAVQTAPNNAFSHDISTVWPEWQIEKQLGRGSYGVVYQAVRRDNNVESHAAIKIISIPSDYSEVDSLHSEGLDIDGTRTYFKGIVDDFASEIQLMESLKGIQNIVSVEDYKVVEKTDAIGWDIYIRMELLTPFNTYICDKTLSEEEIIKLGTDICTALEICNQRNIIHRDIKPENIFVNDFGYFKLGDFGIARKLKNMTGGLSQKGTFNYMAPEVTNSNEYDARVDIYSLGIVLYRLLNNNRLPFLDNSKQLLNPNERKLAIERRIRGEALPVPCNASPSMANIILRACAFEPDARFASATEMKQALMDVANGTYTMVDTSLSKTSFDRTTNANYDETATIKTPIENAVHMKTPAINTFGEAPKKKAKKVKIIVISILSLIIVIAIGIFANFAYGTYKDNSETTNILNKAEEYYENGDYENAISEYSKVPKSSKNYENAQEQLNKVYSDYINSTVESAKKHNSSKDYKQAVQVINAAYNILPDAVDVTKLDTTKEESLTSYKTDVANEVAELTEDEKWSEAFDAINEAISFDDNEYFQNLKISTEDSYVKSVSETVQQHLDNEDYISAKRVIDNSLTVLPNNIDLKSLQSDVEKATPTYLLDVVKPYATSNYIEYPSENNYNFSMGTKTYTHGFSLVKNGHDGGYAIFNTDSKYTKLGFLVGHIDGTSMFDATITVFCDGVPAYQIDLSSEALPEKSSVDITGVKQVKFVMTPIGRHYDMSPHYGFANVTVE